MKRLAASALVLSLAISACSREGGDAPAPDVMPQAETSAPAAVSETAAPSVETATTPREPDYIYLAQIRKAGAAATGKRARMFLKLYKRYDDRPNWVLMLATDGSYSTTRLHYEDSFKPMVDEMKRGYVYEVEFEISGVSSGGQPFGEIVSIDKRTAGAVTGTNQFLPAVEAVEQARQLPPEVKAQRREAMREQLTEIVEKVEGRTEEIREEQQAASQSNSQSK